MKVKGVYYLIIFSAMLLMAVLSVITFIFHKWLVFALTVMMLTNLAVLMLMILIAMSVSDRVREKVIWTVNFIFIILLITSIALFMRIVISNIKAS